MYIIALITFIIHIVAFVAGGANGVLMPVLGPRMETASPELRSQLLGVVEGVSKIGKYAMGVLLLSGILTLWLKWDWQPPSPLWFGIKMALVLLMIVLIGMQEMSARRARAGDMAARAQASRLGQFTGFAFLGVIIAAVFAFN